MAEIKKFDWRTLKTVQRDIFVVLKSVCPDLDYQSGIYFWKRQEEDKSVMYIGKARKLAERNISHTLSRVQEIDRQIKKYGLYDKETNQIGFELKVLHFPEEKLNEMESYYINIYSNKKDTILLNIESGGQTDKGYIADRKQPKGYKRGKEIAQKQLMEDIRTFFTKYLDFAPKNQNKVTLRKLEEFKELLENK